MKLQMPGFDMKVLSMVVNNPHAEETRCGAVQPGDRTKHLCPLAFFGCACKHLQMGVLSTP